MLLLLVFSGAAAAGQPHLSAQSLSVLFETLRGAVGIDGDITLSLQVQKKITSLGRKDPDAVVSAVIEHLQSDGKGRSTDYRIALISILEGMGAAAQDAVPLLTDIAQGQGEENEWVILKAVSALAAAGTPPADEAVRESGRRNIESWLRTARPGEVGRFVSLQDFFIRRELRSDEMSEETIETAVLSLLPLGENGKKAAGTLARAHSDPRIGAELRSVIEEALLAAGAAGPPTLAALEVESGAGNAVLKEIIADSQSGDSTISGLAMGELGDLGPSPEVIDALIDALRQNRNAGQAALILGEFGPSAAGSVTALLPHVRNRESGANVITALGKIGRADEAVIDILRSILSDPSSPHRAVSAEALGSLGSVKALRELTEALSAPDKYTRILAARSLGRFGSEARDVVLPLTALLHEKDEDVRIAAVEALGSIGPSAADAVPGIAEQLQVSNSRLKRSAAAALERIGGDRALTALEGEAFRHSSADERTYDRLRASGDEVGLHRYLRGLTPPRRLHIARRMTKEADPLPVYLGSSLLVAEGFEEEAVPALAGLIASGEDQRALKGRFGYDWIHTDDPMLFERIMSAIRLYLSEHKGAFSPSERERIGRFLSSP